MLFANASPRRVGLFLFVAGLLLYTPALTVQFVGDDVALVNAAVNGASLIQLPKEFTVQLLRPVTYATYWVEARLWGAWAPGFHFTSVVLHLLSSWLLFLIVDLLSGRRTIALWVAALFLVSSVHSEAVTTIFGRTEPVMTAALLGTTWAWARFRVRGGRGWCIAAYVLFGVALFAKEPSLLYGGVLAVLEGWLTLRDAPRSKLAGLTGFLVRMLPFTVLAALYLATRWWLFGHPLGTYGGFDPTPIRILLNTRPFLFRTLVPGTIHNGAIVNAGLDVVTIAVLLIATTVAAVSKRDRGLIVFSAAGLALTLLAVLPLSISVFSTESERFVYLPSVFAAVLTVLAIERLLPRPAWFNVAMTVFLVAHVVTLTHQNLKWIAAGHYVWNSIETMSDQIASEPDVDAVMVLNMADSASGVFLFRSAFHAGIEMYQPALLAGSPIWAVSAHRIASVSTPVVVSQTGPRAFHLEVHGGQMIRPVDSSWFYRITNQTPEAFDVEFTDVTRRWLVLYASGGTTHRVAVIDGPGAPFGNVDTAAASCGGEPVTIAGWALDLDGVEKVTIEQARPGSDRWAPLVDAAWMPGPSLPGLEWFQQYSGSHRAWWSATVPCTVGSGSTSVQLRAVAVDRSGITGELLGRSTLTRR